MRQKKHIYIILLLLSGLLIVSPCWAFHGNIKAGPIHAAFYAPDWTWQKAGASSEMGADVNILGILENTSDIPVDASITLQLPPPESGFIIASATRLTQVVSLQPRETRRMAFVQISALNRVKPGSYPFQIVMTASGERHSLNFSVRTIRGAVVSQSAWAKLVPAAISLGWCLVIGLALRRFMKPGMWREPYAPEIEGGREA